MNTPRCSSTWLNRTVLGIGLASLFSDWSHEIATTVMPAFLATAGSRLSTKASTTPTVS